MRIFISALFCLAPVWLAGCSSDSAAPKAETVTHVVPAGEKAGAGHLTYNVTDSQVLTQLGDEANPRIPHDRFLLVQVAVTNSSNVDNPIPAIQLLSDSGKTYNELADGAGVTDWMGIDRHVGPGQTDRGEVVFDAPAAHYRLRVMDESMKTEAQVDLPLTYARESVSDTNIPPSELPDALGPTGSLKKK